MVVVPGMNATPEQLLRLSVAHATETADLLRQLADHARQLSGPGRLVIRDEAIRLERMARFHEGEAAKAGDKLEDLLHPERVEARARSLRESLRAVGVGRLPSGELT